MQTRILSAAALLLCWPAIGQEPENEPRGREHSVPLFMAHGDPEQRQGFVRIINHSDEAGTVEIVGIDDAGMRFGPIELSIATRETKHLNSADIENGNEGKGLPDGLGDGEGDWRLLLYAGSLDIEPLAYIRTLHDGFLTSMHDMVQDASLRHRVPIFNPASNVNQESSLRLINPGDSEASVTITGRDGVGDEQQAGGTGEFTLSIPAGGARTVASPELETGNAESEGIGDGTGKWSLDVRSDVPIEVVNLMSTVSGHLTNLSSTNPDYLGATGLWQISFDDEEGGDGYVVLLPDSRMFAWLPESDAVDRIARGTFETTPDGISGAGDLYESGKVEVAGLDVSGGSEDFELTAEYRPGDWIRGRYNAVGETGRSFHGWAFTGFGRGAAIEDVAGLWSPVLGDEADLSGDFEPTADGSLSLSFEAGSFTCNVDGDIGAVNPAFSVYEADVTVTCSLLIILAGSVDLIVAVMDAPNEPGGGTRAIVLAIVHDERKIAYGAFFDLERP